MDTDTYCVGGKSHKVFGHSRFLEEEKRESELSKLNCFC